MRKVIQMAVALSRINHDDLHGDSLDNENLLMALCDDGTMWRFWYDDNEWMRLQDVPQD